MNYSHISFLTIAFLLSPMLMAMDVMQQKKMDTKIFQGMQQQAKFLRNARSYLNAVDDANKAEKAIELCPYVITRKVAKIGSDRRITIEPTKRLQLTNFDITSTQALGAIFMHSNAWRDIFKADSSIDANCLGQWKSSDDKQLSMLGSMVAELRHNKQLYMHAKVQRDDAMEILIAMHRDIEARHVFLLHRDTLDKQLQEPLAPIVKALECWTNYIKELKQDVKSGFIEEIDKPYDIKFRKNLSGAVKKFFNNQERYKLLLEQVLIRLFGERRPTPLSIPIPALALPEVPEQIEPSAVIPQDNKIDNTYLVVNDGNVTHYIFKTIPAIGSKKIASFNYTSWVTMWFTNPEQAYTKQGYANPWNPRYKYRTTARQYHAFSWEIDKIALTHGVQSATFNKKTNQNDLLIALPGKLVIDNTETVGLYIYIIDSQNGLCYHRLFTPRDGKELLNEYLENGNFNYTNPGFYDVEFPVLDSKN